MVEGRKYMKSKISEMLVAVHTHTHTQACLQKRKERRKLYLSFSPITSERRLYIKGGGLVV